LNLELGCEQTKSNIFRPTPNLHVAASAKPFSLNRQASSQLIVTHFDVISNFTAFECCDHGICNAPPSHGLPIHQFTDFDAQIVRLSHAVRPLVMSNGEDHSADSERFLNEPISAAPAAQLRRLKASSPPRAQILSQRNQIIRHIAEFPDRFGVAEIAGGVAAQQRSLSFRAGAGAGS
jgi:hypothetical protein